MSSFEERLQQVTELISLPEIYLKIRRLMADPTSDIDDFANVIRVDPNLSVAVLKLVNSAYFGFSGQIDSISRAVNMIGIGQLHNMVLGISSVSALNFPNDFLPLKSFWRSCIFTGVLTRLLAEQLSIKQNDGLFVTGLLHEIGHLVLYAKFPEQAKQTLQLAEQQSLSIDMAEREVLGYHYGEIGAMLMAQWDLPIDMQSLTRQQPTPSEADDQAVETALLHLAHGIAHRQFAKDDLTLDQIIDPRVWATIQLTPEQIEPTIESARGLSADMERALLR